MTLIKKISRIKTIVLDELSNSKQCIPLGILFNGAGAFHWMLKQSTRPHGTLSSRSRTVLKREMKIILGPKIS